MKRSLIREHILPFFMLLSLLGVATLAGDYILHRFNMVWIGRYMGIPGTLLIIASFWYSLRKRKYVTSGNVSQLLKAHEFLAWLGSLMVLIHAGIHFNSILPWLATIAMGINVMSGLVGKYLLKNAREHVQAARETFQLRGLSKNDVEKAVFWDAVTIDVMAKWRKIHIPIFIIFAVLAISHISSIFLFWSWI